MRRRAATTTIGRTTDGRLAGFLACVSVSECAAVRMCGSVWERVGACQELIHGRAEQVAAWAFRRRTGQRGEARDGSGMEGVTVKKGQRC